MKKISSLALALAFTMPLAGCPGDDSGTTMADTGTAPTTTEGATTEDPTEGPAETTEGPVDTTEGPSDTTGNPPSGGFCIHQCGADEDCTIGGMDVGLTCVDGLCTGESTGCTDDLECQAQFSGWIMPCTAGGGECDALMQVCVDVGGEGLCATPPSEFIDCATLMQDEIMTTDIDGADVTVCGNSTAACGAEGFCFDPCTEDADCVSEAYPVCNTTSGLCECGDDSHCETLDVPQATTCVEGACGCADDQGCVDGGAGDVCNSGACGCSGDDACAKVENTFDGGMISCVEV